MNRRDFLKASLLSAGALSLPPTQLSAAEEMADIAVINTTDIAGGVKRAVEMIGGIGRFVKSGDKVVIKPNMSFASGIDAAANTHPLIVATIVELCRDAGAKKISVLDNTLSNPRDALSYSGIETACNSIVKGCVSAVKEERFFSEVSVKGGSILKNTKVIKEVLEADVLIGAPKVKSHVGAGVSMTLKGMMGLIYSRSIFHMSGLHECIADLYTVLKPAFTVLDATKVMTTGGPGGPGNVKTYDEIIAAVDAVAGDAFAVARYEWYGRKVTPMNVGYLKEAAKRSLGRIDTENLKVISGEL
jgi:uncharacterized protein (DUF362 family)